MATLLDPLPVSKPIKSNLPSDIANSHSRQWKESRRVANLSNKHVDTVVTPIRSYQVSIHHSMRGSSSKVSNPKLDSLQVRGVNDESLRISHSFNYCSINILNFINLRTSLSGI